MTNKGVLEKIQYFVFFSIQVQCIQRKNKKNQSTEKGSNIIQFYKLIFK